MSNATDIAGNLQQIEAGSPLPHDRAITGTLEARTVAEAASGRVGTRRKLPPTLRKPRARGRELIAGAVRTLSSVPDIWAQL